MERLMKWKSITTRIEPCSAHSRAASAIATLSGAPAGSVIVFTLVGIAALCGIPGLFSDETDE